MVGEFEGGRRVWRRVDWVGEARREGEMGGGFEFGGWGLGEGGWKSDSRVWRWDWRLEGC